MIEVVKAEVIHAQRLQMRDADRAEVYAATGRDPQTALVESVLHSTVAWAGLIEEVPVAIFGVGPLNILSGLGSPWLLGSDELEKHSFELLRKSRPYVTEMHRSYPVLFNLVDQRNVVSQRWLRWLGFTLHAPIPYGHLGLPFIPFEKEAHV